jgi:hypothetical protein
VTVLESHDVAGGAAHAWSRDGFTFESGPSLYSAMAARPSGNPIAQVLHALDEPLPVVKYNTWQARTHAPTAVQLCAARAHIAPVCVSHAIVHLHLFRRAQCHLPEGSFLTEIGNDQFDDVLLRYHGAAAVAEWAAVKTLMAPLAVAAAAVPAAAVRSDAGALLTLARFLPRLATLPPGTVGSLLKPYSDVIAGTVSHPFIKRWLDLLCFLLSGAPSEGTLAAEIGYMFGGACA